MLFRSDRVEISVLGAGNATSSPLDTPLWSRVERATRALVDGARIIPGMGGISSDARYFRELGATAYGVGLFNPAVPPEEFVSRVHGDNERIDLVSLDLLGRFWDAVLTD